MKPCILILFNDSFKYIFWASSSNFRFNLCMWNSLVYRCFFSCISPNNQNLFYSFWFPLNSELSIRLLQKNYLRPIHIHVSRFISSTSDLRFLSLNWVFLFIFPDVLLHRKIIINCLKLFNFVEDKHAQAAWISVFSILIFAFLLITKLNLSLNIEVMHHFVLT
jgi:hypothetical protein